jgi:hypothetical protein
MAAWVAHSSSLVARSYRRERNQYAELNSLNTPRASQKPPSKSNGLLLAEAESLNNRLVALGVVFFEVVEQATPLADQHEKTAA